MPSSSHKCTYEFNSIISSVMSVSVSSLVIQESTLPGLSHVNSLTWNRLKCQVEDKLT